MAYEIKIIGDNNPILLETDAGMRVKAAYEDDNVPDTRKLKIGDSLSIRKGQIRFVRKVEDAKSTSRKSNAIVDDINKRDLEIYRSWLSKRPEQRADRLALFSECYRTIHGMLPSEEVKALVRTDLRKFFEENPKRTYGNGDIYVNHMDRRKKNAEISVFQSPIFRLMERVIAEDMRRAM